MADKFRAGSVIEAGEGWYMDDRGLQITFFAAARKIEPGTRFVIEEITPGEAPRHMGDIYGADVAMVSPLNADGTYNADAPKLTVDVGQDWNSNTLTGKKAVVVAEMKRIFV